MTRTKSQTGKIKTAQQDVATANGTQTPPEVMTLAETAAYLRVTSEDVLKMVAAKDLPGRKVGETWRFLRSTIQSWLSTPPPNRGLLSLFGAAKDDPYAEEMLKDIYKRRGRSITEDD